MRIDGLSNLVSGLGANNAKASESYYSLDFDPVQADAAFYTSTWYGKILQIPVDDATRKWRSWNAEKDQIEAIEAEENRLSLRLKVHEALLVARHCGGAAIVVGGLNGNPRSPLGSVPKGSLKFLHVLARDEISPRGITSDPYSPYFRQPEFWQINNTLVHPSRVIIFNGRRPPRPVLGDQFWGVGIWSHLADSVMASDTGAAILVALMHEAKVDIIKIPGLTEGLANEVTTDEHLRRWKMVAQMKSIANVLMLDAGDGEGAGEEWNQKQISFQTIPEVQQMLLKIMAGAADIPVTRLLGEQQTGLSGADSGSLRNYYDAVTAEQELRLTPALAPLDDMLIQSALGSRPPEIWYQWNPLWQLTETEKAEIDKTESEAALNYVESNLLPIKALEKAVQNRMIESGRWPGLEKALVEHPNTEPRPAPIEQNPQPEGGRRGGGTAPGSGGRGR